MKNLVSYWRLDKDYIVYESVNFKVIKGYYNHKNNANYEKSLGICWENYPKSRGKLSPIVIKEDVRDAFLSGLLNKFSKDSNKRIKILQAIDFFIPN